MVEPFNHPPIGNVKPIWNLVEPLSRIRMIMRLYQTLIPSGGTILEPCGTLYPLVEPCGTFFVSSCCQLSLKVQGRNHRSHRGPAIALSKIKISNF